MNHINFLVACLCILLPCCNRCGGKVGADTELQNVAQNEIRMCELARGKAQIRDWPKEWGTFLPVEDGGMLLMVNQPATSLDSIKQSLSILNPKGRVFVGCIDFLLLWMPCSDCNPQSSDWQAIRRMIGPSEVLRAFPQESFDRVQDCLKERIPVQRCRKHVSGLLSTPGCGGRTRDDRRERNQLMIKLGLAELGSSVCLGINDK